MEINTTDQITGKAQILLYIFNKSTIKNFNSFIENIKMTIGPNSEFSNKMRKQLKNKY